MSTSDADHMTAGQFLRQFAAGQNRVQLALIALCWTAALLFEATLPLSFPMPAWAKLTAGAAMVVISHAVLWMAFGSQRVQRWVMGS